MRIFVRISGLVALTAGLLLYPIMKLLGGRVREIRAGAVVLAILCAVYFVFGLPH